MEDESDNVKTKSISDILEPLANQLLMLENLLSTETDVISHGRKLCKDLAFVVTDLCKVIEQLTKTSDPSHLQPKGNDCAKQLKVVALDLKNLSINPQENHLRQELPDVGSYLLSSLMKSLVWYDETILFGIQNSIKNCKYVLTALEKSRVVYELLPLTKNLVNEAAILYPMVYNRINDLISLSHKNNLSVKLSTLHKLLKLHLKAITNLARFPLSRHARASRDFVIKEMLACLCSISEVLDSKVGDSMPSDDGRFLRNMDKVLEVLETNDRHSTMWQETESFVLNVIEHAVLLSQSCEPKDRNVISSTCERVLKEFNVLQELLKTTEVSSSDFQLACEILADFLELLEQSVNTALLKRMVFLNAGVEHTQNLLREKVRSTAEDRKPEDLQALLEEFDNHLDSVLQTAFFSVASTGDVKKVRLIYSAMQGIESASTELVAAWVNAYMQPKDEATIRNLKLWQHFFAQEVMELRQNLDSITDPAAFCQVVENELRPVIAVLKRDINAAIPTAVKNSTSKIDFLTKRVLMLVQEQLLCTAEFKENKLPVESLKKCLNEFKGAEFLVYHNVQDQSLRFSLVKRAELIISYVTRLVDALKEEEEWEEAETYLSISTNKTVQGLQSPDGHFPLEYNQLPMDITEHRNPLPNKSKLSNTRRPIRSSRKRNAETPLRNVSLGPATPLRANYTAVLKQTPNKPWRKLWQTPNQSTAPTAKSPEPEVILRSNSPSEPDQGTLTFDLTEILDQLTSLDSTLRSNLTGNTTVVTKNNPSMNCGSMDSVVTPSLPSNFTLDSQSAAFSTPQRLDDLHLAKRLDKIQGNVRDFVN